MQPKVRKLLLDIALSCNEIREFISGKNFDDFKSDRILQLAIERQFEIIGEALSRLVKLKKLLFHNESPTIARLLISET